MDGVTPSFIVYPLVLLEGLVFGRDRFRLAHLDLKRVDPWLASASASQGNHLRTYVDG